MLDHVDSYIKAYDKEYEIIGPFSRIHTRLTYRDGFLFIFVENCTHAYIFNNESIEYLSKRDGRKSVSDLE